MSQRYEYCLDLRIHHPSLDPGDISRALRMRAGISWRVGEPRVSLRGEPLPGVRRETYWAKTLTPGWVKVPRSTLAEARVTSVLKRLRGQAAFLRRLRRTGGTAAVWVSSYSTTNYSFIFEPALIKSVHDLGCELIVDVYPYRQK